MSDGFPVHSFRNCEILAEAWLLEYPDDAEHYSKDFFIKLYLGDEQLFYNVWSELMCTGYLGEV